MNTSITPVAGVIFCETAKVTTAMTQQAGVSKNFFTVSVLFIDIEDNYISISQ